jgi:hypothetical protein
MREPVVAVALLTREELDIIGPTLERVWPVEQVPGFEDLLRAIDEADRRLAANDPGGAL